MFAFIDNTNCCRSKRRTQNGSCFFLLMFQFCLSQCVVLQFLASDSDSYVVEFSAIFRLASSSSVFYLVLFLKKVVFIYNSLSNIFCLFGKRTDEETSGYILI